MRKRRCTSVLSRVQHVVSDLDTSSEDEGMSGELSVSLYDTRSAGRNWRKYYTDLLFNYDFSEAR